ncbi:MAG: beta galactosidase jelly roll domain-containing protein, partial [Clostridia bacterium]|nr:beta galactosidase jelly roll domain-containing protein [Clostridia bacterium]
MHGELGMYMPAFVVYIGFYWRVLEPAKAMSKAYASIQRGLVSGRRLFAILLGLIPVTLVSAAAPTAIETAEVADAAIVLKDNWYVLTDKYNKGEEEKWYQGFPDKGDKVSLPDNAGSSAASVWYYNRFTPDLNLTEDQRVIAAFEGCQYYTKVWLNGNYIGDHEGSYGKFSFDLTDFLREDQENMLALLLFAPNDGSTIRGEDFSTLPLGLTSAQYIQTPVYLTVVPDLAIADVFVDTKYENGDVHVQVIVDNPGQETVPVKIGAQISPNNQNILLAQTQADFKAVPGLSKHTVSMNLKDFHAWSPDDPYLYSTRVTVQAEEAAFIDSTVIQVGFKDFRIDSEGYFMLNGERFYVKSLLTSPSGTNEEADATDVGVDRERRFAQFDYYKACGFNMVRFQSGPAIPDILDYCDKIGLLVYQEIGMAHKGESEQAQALIRREIRQLVERDRNHASFAIVGVLNETYDNEVDYEALNNYQAALHSLDVFRTYDNDLLVFLSSGRWDYDSATASASNPGSLTWDGYMGDEGVRKENGTHIGRTGIGDIHQYPLMPFNKDVRDVFMNYDMLRACFISESGVGSQSNIVSGIRIRQQESQGAFEVNRTDISALYDLYDKHEMYTAYGTPELLLRDTQQLQSNLHGLLFDFIRSNSRIGGYSL